MPDSHSSTGGLPEKYRPQKLDELMGQEWVVDQLRVWLKSPYSTAFVFEGGTGAGKTSAAVVLARELGIDVPQAEFGGFHEIASGEQTGESVRKMMGIIHNRPWSGSGWRMVIVNEADAMTVSAAYIWLDALENLPPQSVVVFTTNHLHKLPQRLRDRCECFHFESKAMFIAEALQALAEKVWLAETGRSDCPAYADMGVAPDDEGNISFRRLLQSMTPHVRAAVNGLKLPPKKESEPEKPAKAKAPRAPSVPAPVFDVDAIGRRWAAGEAIKLLAAEVGISWNKLHGFLTKAGYHKREAVCA